MPFQESKGLLFLKGKIIETRFFVHFIFESEGTFQIIQPFSISVEFSQKNFTLPGF